MKMQIIKYKSVDSTNNVAIRRINKGQIKPTLIIAKNQKKGRGQYGRRWVSYQGNIFITIYFSIKKNILIKSISKRITSRTKAIICTHHFGNICDMKAILTKYRKLPSLQKVFNE